MSEPNYQSAERMLAQQYGAPEHSHTETWRDGPNSTRSITCYSKNSQMEAMIKAQMAVAERRGQALREEPKHQGFFGLFGF